MAAQARQAAEGLPKREMQESLLVDAPEGRQVRGIAIGTQCYRVPICYRPDRFSERIGTWSKESRQTQCLATTCLGLRGRVVSKPHF